MVKIFRTLLLAAALFALPIFFSAQFAAQAQDDSMMDEVVCDSTVITLLFLAENDYGFTSENLDLSVYAKGQYSGIFDAMMAMMDGEMMDDEMADDEMMDDMADDEMMDDEMADDEMMDDMVTLTPGHIEGEAEPCNALREELDVFFQDVLLGGDMMMESDG